MTSLPSITLVIDDRGADCRTLSGARDKETSYLLLQYASSYVVANNKEASPGLELGLRVSELTALLRIVLACWRTPSFA